MVSEYETELKKYNTPNLIVRLVLRAYTQKICTILREIAPRKMLDAGCGPGFLMKEVSACTNAEIYGIDVLESSVKHAKKLCPKAKVFLSSLYSLPFKANYFDTVLCSEVLEHLDEPEKALSELKRVSGRYCIVCVPYEPFFSIANLLRLQYLKSLGSYPGHIHRWGKKSFRQLLSGYFSEVKIKKSSIWLIGVCKK